jgi:uncharacterized repeat protein (TIGR02543 family)
MKRILSLVLTLAMFATLVTLPLATATNNVTLTVRQNGSGALVAGQNITAEVFLDAGARGVASISFLDINFNTSVLEWRPATGTYNPELSASWPFTQAGTQANANRLQVVPPQTLTTPAAGRVRFSFDSETGALTGSGVILILNFRVRSGITPPSNTPVTASWAPSNERPGAGMAEFGGTIVPSTAVAFSHVPIGQDSRTVTINNEPTSVVPTGQVGAGSYTSGQQVTITAGSHNLRPFQNWTVVSGGVTLANPNNNTTTFNMPTFTGPGTNGNVVVRANWGNELANQPVTMAQSPNNNLATGFSPASGTRYIGNSVVSLNAGTRASGWHFVNWTVSPAGITVTNPTSATAASFTMPATPVAVTVTANWEQRATVTVNTEGSPGASGAGTYANGSQVIIRAGQRTGWTFTNWTVNSGGVSLAASTSPITTFNMGASAVTVTANWEQNITNTGFTIPVSIGVVHSGSQATQWATSFPGNVLTFTGQTATAQSYQPGTYNLRVNPNNTGGGWAFGQNAGTAGHERLIVITVSASQISVQGRAWDAWGGVSTPSDSANARLLQNASGAVFVSWSATVPSGYTQVAGNTLSATSVPTPTANVTVSGSQMATNNNGQGTYAENRVVGLDAGTHATQPFNGWTISPSSITLTNANSRIARFTMPSPPVAVTVTATWGTATPRTLTVNAGTGGTAGGGGTFNSGASVTATATPNSGQRFVNWTVVTGTAPAGVNNSTSNPLTFNMPDNNLTIRANFEAIPAIGGTASVSGTTTVGQTLTAVTTGITPAGLNLTYQWQRTGTGTNTTWGNVPANGNAATYVLTGDDFDRLFRVQISATNATGGPINSSQTAARVVRPALTGVPAITGTARVGMRLDAGAGTLNITTGLTYQWQWSANGTSGWTNLATGANYTPVAGDQGRHIRVQATSSNASGTQNSTAVGPVLEALAMLPSNAAVGLAYIFTNPTTNWAFGYNNGDATGPESANASPRVEFDVTVDAFHTLTLPPWQGGDGTLTTNRDIYLFQPTLAASPNRKPVTISQVTINGVAIPSSNIAAQAQGTRWLVASTIGTLNPVTTVAGNANSAGVNGNITRFQDANIECRTFYLAAGVRINAGDVVAITYQVGDGGATQINPTVNWPTSLSATYGQFLSNITLPNNGSGTPGTFSWVAAAATTRVGAAGTRQHELRFTPTDTNAFNTVTQNVNVSVAALRLTWSANGTVQNRVYNRTTTATVATAPTLVGIISGDTVSIVPGTVNFNNANVGNGKTVTATGYGISGNANYLAPTAQPVFANANVTALQLTWSGGNTVHNKVFDGNDTATVANAPSLVGIISGDTVNIVVGTVRFNNAAVGNGKTVTATGYSISGNANYSAPSAQPVFANANITPAPVIFYGDVNGDGVINSGDVTMLKYYIADSDRLTFGTRNPTFRIENARVRDGVSDPNAADVSLLQLWIATPVPDRHTVILGPR